jgi:hypothetical protein
MIVLPSFRLWPFMLCVLGCAETSMPSSSLPRPVLDEDDPLSMIPAEADLVLSADLAKLRASPWTHASVSRVAEGDSGTAGAAFDQIRDVERVVFAKVPSLGEGATVLVAQGGIDRERMRKSFAKGAAATANSSYRGAELVTRGEESLAFVGGRTAVSGPALAVRAAIDCNFGVARAIDSEAWFQAMRGLLGRGRDPGTLVAALFVHLQPATRAALMQEMGEGENLEEFAARIDLGEDLDVTAMGAVRTEAQARDLAGRLSERIRDASVRPIVAAFGFASVLDSVRFVAKENHVVGTAHVSQRERTEIALRMAAVAELMAKLRQTEGKP